MCGVDLFCGVYQEQHFYCKPPPFHDSGPLYVGIVYYILVAHVVYVHKTPRAVGGGLQQKTCSCYDTQNTNDW